jgi:formylglycine-generating enzyme required for sulfatase activity
MRSFFLVHGLLAALLSCLHGQPPTRKALLLINTDYAGAPKLALDSTAMEALKSALTAATFDVKEYRNLTQAGILSQIGSTYLSTLHSQDVVVFYYYGYALQANADNFLLPVDFNPESKDPLSRRAQSLTGFIQALDEKKVGLKVILMDSPLQPPEILTSADGPGLTFPDLTDIREVAYLASDARNAPPKQLNAKELSSFARHLTMLLRKPGMNLKDLLSGAEAAVSAETQKLTPVSTTQGTQPFQFTEPPPPPPDKDTFTSRDHVNRKDRQSYVYVAPGKFLMGCVPGDDRCDQDEKPQHEVTITKGFWMGETEVSVEAYLKFAETSTPKRKMPSVPLGRSGWKQTNLPMANMSVEDAKAFCAFAGGRLPTEAEWEYAARAGKANEIVPLSAENAREKANFYGKQGNDRFEYEAPIKQFDANAYGLFDMFGNVWELVSDIYSPSYYAESPKEDPPGPTAGREYVTRGGSYDSDAQQHLRISIRRRTKGGNVNLGFRCVIPDSPEARQSLQ